MLLILLPLPLLGALALRRPPGDARRACRRPWSRRALFYSLYYITALHPRFLYVALPALFILAGIGLQLLVERFGRDRRDHAVRGLRASTTIATIAPRISPISAPTSSELRRECADALTAAPAR